MLFETWMPVKDYERTHEVSSLGRVRSKDRHDSRGRFWPGMMLKTPRGSHGYRVVCLRDTASGRKAKLKGVHALVLESFRGPRPLGHYACHKDDDRLNNIVDNLYWGSPKDNARDARCNGRI